MSSIEGQQDYATTFVPESVVKKTSSNEFMPQVRKKTWLEGTFATDRVHRLAKKIFFTGSISHSHLFWQKTVR